MLANNLRNAQYSYGPQKRSKKVNYAAMHNGDLDDEYISGPIHMYVSKKKGESKKGIFKFLSSPIECVAFERLELLKTKKRVVVVVL